MATTGTQKMATLTMSEDLAKVMIACTLEEFGDQDGMVELIVLAMLFLQSTSPEMDRNEIRHELDRLAAELGKVWLVNGGV